MEKNNVEILLVEDDSDAATLASLAFEKNKSIAPVKIHHAKDQLSLDEDLRKALLITDNLLAKLPDYTIEVFAQSEDFSLYKKVLNR